MSLPGSVAPVTLITTMSPPAVRRQNTEKLAAHPDPIAPLLELTKYRDMAQTKNCTLGWKALWVDPLLMSYDREALELMLKLLEKVIDTPSDNFELRDLLTFFSTQQFLKENPLCSEIFKTTQVAFVHDMKTVFCASEHLNCTRRLLFSLQKILDAARPAVESKSDKTHTHENTRAVDLGNGQTGHAFTFFNTTLRKQFFHYVSSLCRHLGTGLPLVKEDFNAVLEDVQPQKLSALMIVMGFTHLKAYADMMMWCLEEEDMVYGLAPSREAGEAMQAFLENHGVPIGNPSTFFGMANAAKPSLFVDGKRISLPSLSTLRGKKQPFACDGFITKWMGSVATVGADVVRARYAIAHIPIQRELVYIDQIINLKRKAQHNLLAGMVAVAVAVGNLLAVYVANKWNKI